MDSIDRIIIEKLKLNCRTNFQDLSKILGISSHSIKSRVDKLVETGIIERFVVYLSPLMTNEDSVIAILEFESEQHEKQLLSRISKNPSISKVSRLIDGRYIVFGIYFDAEELSSLTMQLRKLPGIRTVHLHSRFLHYWGGKTNLANSHREILRCLVINPRMTIIEISKKTGLPFNEIKMIIDKMRESETVLLTISTSGDLDGRDIEVLAKVQWNVGKTSKEQVLTWLQGKFLSSYLGEYVSATEPTLFFNFSVTHVQEVDVFMQKVIDSGLVTHVEPMIMYPRTTFSDPRHRRVIAMLEETGFSPQDGPFS